MRTDCHRLAQRVYLADALEVLDESPQLALDQRINPAKKILDLSDHQYAKKRLNLKDAHFEIEVIAFWIMNQLDEDYGATLCSSTGGVLKASHPILFHPDQFFYFYLRFPLREMTELQTVFEEFDASRMKAHNLWDRYTCLDGETGLVKVKNQTKRQFAQYFGGYPNYQSDGGIFDNYVKPFLGWYLVFDQEEYPENDFEFLEVIGLANKRWEKPEFVDGANILRKKRGPKPAPAKQEFSKRYPLGLPEGLSADAVAAELTEAGFPITGRSVQNYDRERSNSK